MTVSNREFCIVCVLKRIIVEGQKSSGQVITLTELKQNINSKAGVNSLKG